MKAAIIMSKIRKRNTGREVFSTFYKQGSVMGS